MCGILGVVGPADGEQVELLSRRIGHRGPDERDGAELEGAILRSERLAIIDPARGRQPIRGADGACAVHNGEIYNHRSLRETTLGHRAFRSKTDSEVIVQLYEELGEGCLEHLDGVFAFLAVGGPAGALAARDPMGVKPLYQGRDGRGAVWFSSELKAIHDVCESVRVVPPGHCWTPAGGLRPYRRFGWRSAPPRSSGEGLREALEAAVERRIMSDVPVGALISGGLDSSLVASIAARLAGGPLDSFSIGAADSLDLRAARQVAEHLGTRHHEVHFTPEEGLAALRDVIFHVESYDIPSIRAGVPMFLLSRFIREKGLKVVLSGEGADEAFGGYLYFHEAPDAEAFHRECIRRLGLLHTSDLQRADKASMAHGVEARVPFLDASFLDVAMAIDPELKRPRPGRIEKAVLREAFADGDFLPAEILWRQKEQFSDGVGYSWVDAVWAHAERAVSDRDFAAARERYPFNTPRSKEAFLYRRTFEEFFPGEACARTVTCWFPKWQADQDSSGRANALHVSAEG
ncbi:MAG: asparagine synthase B [Acidobacteriota bacterium]